jgi:voltage-gated potassium channel
MTILRRLAEEDEGSAAVGRHTVLLVSLVLLLVLLPAFRSMPGGELRFAALLCLVLGAAIYVNRGRRWTFFLAALIGIGAIASSAIAETSGSETAHLLASGLGLSLLVFTTLFMLNSLMHATVISTDTIVGGICVFLLMGLCFALAYTIATDLGAGALVEAGKPLLRDARGSSEHAASILYFSFVTLTTLGFGDIVPKGESVRMLVSVEAVTGQLYIAIFIARLVSMRSQ